MGELAKVGSPKALWFVVMFGGKVMQIDSFSQTGNASIPPSPKPAVAELQPASGSFVAAQIPAARGIDIERSFKPIEEVIKPFNISLDFSRDDETGQIVVRMIDKATGETLRQIPDDVVLHLAAALGRLQGQVLDRQV
jgi:flagellar protein FlaG